MAWGLENLVTFLAFFFLSWTYGYSVLGIFKAGEKHPIYHFIAEIMVGIAVFSFLGVVLHLLHIPLNIIVYIALGAVYPAYMLVKGGKGKQFRLKSLKSKEAMHAGILLIMILGLFSVMHSGAFGYPYLENDDPWVHAQGALYVAQENTYDVDPGVRSLNTAYDGYLEPYPPTYDVLMGILRQLNGSVYWTLKFFNALLVSIALAGFFLLFKEYTRSDTQALFGTLLLAVLPSFMSHFIWSQTIALTIFPVALYCSVKALGDDAWRWPAVICVASMMVTQPVVSAVFGVTYIVFFLLLIPTEWKKKGKIMKRFPKSSRAFIVGAAGLGLSFVFWGDQMVKWGISGILGLKGGEVTGGWFQPYTQQVYSLKDIVFAPHASRIDQAIGFGLVATILAVAAVITILLLWRKTLDPRKDWRFLHALLWTLIIGYLLFAPTMGLTGWGSSRMWAYFSIPFALIITMGTFAIINGITKDKKIRLIVVGIVALLVIITSAPAKISVQTAQWPPGVHWTYIEGAQAPEVGMYLAMKETIPRNSRVFAICGSDRRTIGFDMLSEPWDPDEASFRAGIPGHTSEEWMSFLDRNGFEYITLDITCVRKYGENATLDLANTLTNTGRLRQIISQNGFLLAEVV